MLPGTQSILSVICEQEMALARALNSLRASVLSHVSVPVSSSSFQAAGACASLKFVRGFAEGTYLDKAEVEQRVLNAVKNFDKVDPAKVCPWFLLTVVQESLQGKGALCFALFDALAFWCFSAT